MRKRVRTYYLESWESHRWRLLAVVDRKARALREARAAEREGDIVRVVRSERQTIYETRSRTAMGPGDKRKRAHYDDHDPDHHRRAD